MFIEEQFIDLFFVSKLPGTTMTPANFSLLWRKHLKISCLSITNHFHSMLVNFMYKGAMQKTGKDNQSALLQQLIPCQLQPSVATISELHFEPCDWQHFPSAVPLYDQPHAT